MPLKNALSVVIAIAAIGLVPGVFAQEAAISPLMKQLNGGNWLPQEEAEALRDEF